MRLSMRWVGVFVCFLLLAGCGEKEPEIFKLVQLFQEEKYDEAIALAEKLAEANPDDSQAYRFLIKSAFAKGEQEKYKARYQELVQKKPEVAGYHFALGYLHSQSRDYDAAVPYLREAHALEPLALEPAHHGRARGGLGRSRLRADRPARGAAARGSPWGVRRGE